MAASGGLSHPSDEGSVYGTPGKHVFPSDDINPKDKVKKQWCLDYCKAIFSLYVRDLSGIRYSRLADYDLYRLYGEGRQPSEKYLNILCPKNKSGKREGYMNISWDILSVAPKFRQIVMGMFDRVDNDILADAIDERSGAEKENMEFEMKAEKMLRDTVARTAVDDVLTDQKNFPVLPESNEELEMFREIGAFKLKQEIAMEKALKYCYEASNWSQVKNRVYGDLFDLGLAAVKDYTDRDTGMSKLRYVDPRMLVVRYSDDPAYKNVDYGGEIVDYTVTRLKEEVGDAIDVDTLNEIIKNNISKYTNHYDFNRYEDLYSLYDHYSDVTIKVMDVVWFSMDVKKQEKKTTKHGQELVYNKEYDYKQKNSENRSLLVGQKMNVYRAKWVVGSEFIFDYGQQYDIVKDKSKAMLPFHIFRLNKKSMVSQMITVLDNMQLNWLKFQNALAKAAPAGLAIEVGSLKNITDGKNQLTPLEVLRIRRETGDLLYKATTHHSQVLSPNAGRPITETQGGIGPALDEFIKVFEHDLHLIRQITGISEVVDASAPNPNALVGTTNVAVQSTNNILHNMFIAFRNIQESSAKNLARRLQLQAKYGNMEAYDPALGKHLREIIRIGSGRPMIEYGIFLRLRPDDAEKAEIRNDARVAMQAGIITLGDMNFITRMLETGNTKYIEVYLAYKERKAKAEQQALQRENMELNNQGAQQLEDKKQAGTRDKIAADTEGKVIVETTKSNLRREEEDNRNENTQQQKAQEGAIDGAIQEGKNETVKEVEKEKQGTNPVI